LKRAAARTQGGADAGRRGRRAARPAQAGADPRRRRRSDSYLTIQGNPMNEEPDYGAMVKALLAELDVSAYEMAKRSGLTQQAILDIAKGERPNPRAETLRKLLAAAGKKWGWIDGWTKGNAQ
jgi:DNA-binding XRE family transcriptional regulator